MSDKDIDALVIAGRTKHSTNDQCDPLWLIRMTNQLQPMGKEKGLSLVCELATRRVSVGDQIGDDLYWLINLLHDVPAESGFIPPPRIGAISPSPPKDPKAMPRWPLFLARDVPLSAVMSIGLGGEAEPVVSYAKRVAAVAEWRKGKLYPPSDPYATGEAVEATDTYRTLFSDNGGGLTESIAYQLERLTRTAYRPYATPRNRMTGTEAMNLFHMQFGETKAHWDSKLQLYVRGDGTHYPL
jgi:hypothetical protein